MTERPARQEARDLLADRVASQGPAWLNTAGLIRTGWANLWLAPAIDVIAALIDERPAPDID